MASGPAFKPILVVNAGSSSIKFSVFNTDQRKILTGMLSEIGKASRLSMNGKTEAVDCGAHRSALNLILARLADQGFGLSNLGAVAHRVVHGGQALTESCAITPHIREQIAACTHLAPLHNPPSLAAIDAIAELAPDMAQFAVFDTGFHASNPPQARSYSLPAHWRQMGLQRYGFHGISYRALLDHMPKPLPQRLLACHLGNGASLCAILDGSSQATTMGYSPLSGLSMGSRTGDIDALAVLDIADICGTDETRKILNNQSGFIGLAGERDLRELLNSDTKAAKFAISHFIYWLVRHAGSMIAGMGGLDAIAFTGGIGENAPKIRAGLVAGLSFMGASLDDGANSAGSTAIHAPDSRICIYIIPAEEELRILRDVLEMVDDDPAQT